MQDNKHQEQLEAIRAIVGEMPSYIFEYLELSDEIKKEWKYGSKASDFGGHAQFVNKFSKRIEAAITALIQEAALLAKIEVLKSIAYDLAFEGLKLSDKQLKSLEVFKRQLEAQLSGGSNNE